MPCYQNAYMAPLWRGPRRSAGVRPEREQIAPVLRAESLLVLDHSRAVRCGTTRGPRLRYATRDATRCGRGDALWDVRCPQRLRARGGRWGGRAGGYDVLSSGMERLPAGLSRGVAREMNAGDLAAAPVIFWSPL